MAKKPKEKQQKRKQPQTNETSNSSDIFNTLFGATPADPTIASLFSDDNPFRRKPLEVSVQNQTDRLSVSDSSKLGKRKKKDKEVILSSESVAQDNNEDDGNKPDKESNGVVSDSGRKKKGKKVNLSLECVADEANEDEGNERKRVAMSRFELSNDVVSDPGLLPKRENLCSESKESTNKKKKKRKRDAIEAEYEAKRYGVVPGEQKEKGLGVGEVVVGEKRKKMENPQDMMVSDEGFDNENKLLRTIFVGNLPLKIKKKALMKEFGSFGEIESVRIRSIPLADSATPRKAAFIKNKLNENADSVHAYVVFKSEEAAQSSLAHNMAVVEGRHIRVDRACPPRKKMKGENNALYDNKRTVFVGNLPFDVKDEEIYQLFSGIKELESSIEAVRVIRDPNTQLGKGISYVLFKTREAASFVVRKRNLKLRDRELRVFHANANSTPKRKSLSTEGRISSPAKKFKIDSATPGSGNKVKTKAAISYQGMKASKSGIQKKTQSRVSNPGKPKLKTLPSQKPNERKAKRPAVAARKAKVFKAAAAGLKQTGTKRKLENRTPESAGRKKKFRKS